MLIKYSWKEIRIKAGIREIEKKLMSNIFQLFLKNMNYLEKFGQMHSRIEKRKGQYIKNEFF